jgi:hypothetical protein
MKVMSFLVKFLSANIFVLMLFGEGRTSFGVYDIKRSLTPLGWAVVVILPTALIFGLIYLTAKIFKKPKSK